jgi:O-antigen ligase
MPKFKKLLFPLIWIIAGICIILISILLQQTTFLSVIFLPFGLLCFLIYFAFHEFKVIHYLYLSPLLFIQPRLEFNLIYAVGLLFVFLIEKLHKPQSIFIPYFLFFLLLCIAGFRSYFLGIRGDRAFEFFFTECLLPPLLFTIIANSEITSEEIRSLFKYHVYCAAFLGLIGILVAFLRPGERLGSLWSNAMTINGYYILAFFVGIGLLEESEPIKKKTFYVLILIILFGMIFTYTRIVLVGVLIGFILMCIRKPVLFKYLLFLLLAVPFLLPSGMMQRIQMTNKGDVSILIRFLVWFYSLEMIKGNPIWGLGFDSFIVRYKSLLPIKDFMAIHSHNIYLRLMVEMGAIGTLGYLGVIISSLRSGFQSFNKNRGISLTYMIFIAVFVEMLFCITDVFIAQVSVSIFFWILVSFLYKMATNPPNVEEYSSKDLINVIE